MLSGQPFVAKSESFDARPPVTITTAPKYDSDKIHSTIDMSMDTYSPNAECNSVDIETEPD